MNSTKNTWLMPCQEWQGCLSPLSPNLWEPPLYVLEPQGYRGKNSEIKNKAPFLIVPQFLSISVLSKVSE